MGFLVPPCCAHRPLSLSLSLSQAWKVFTLTLDLGAVVGQPGASALTKDFRTPRLSFLYLPPASDPLPQMTAAGPAPAGWCCRRTFQPEPNPFCQADCEWGLQKSADCSSPAGGKTEKDTAVDGGRPPCLPDTGKAVQFPGPFSTLRDGAFILSPHGRCSSQEQRPRLRHCSAQTARRMQCSKMPFFRARLLISSLSNLSEGGW